MRRSLFAAFLALMLATAIEEAKAAEVYRCEVNGVNTFVDSIRSCPAGTALRVGGVPRVVVSPLSSPSPSSSGTVLNRRVVATTAAIASKSNSLCAQRSHAGPAAFRACVRDERLQEVRQIATTRLAGLSRSVSEFVRQSSKIDGLIASTNKGSRPAEWCEEFLRDALAGKNLDVVDDESAAGPRWITTEVGGGRKAAPVLDENFRDVQTVAGDRVASGYVTVRWRGDNTLVLRVDSSCVELPGEVVRCNPVRIHSVLVYDDVTPVACNITLVERPYWPNWKDSMTPILNRESGPSELARAGIPLRKDRKAPRLPER